MKFSEMRTIIEDILNGTALQGKQGRSARKELNRVFEALHKFKDEEEYVEVDDVGLDISLEAGDEFHSKIECVLLNGLKVREGDKVLLLTYIDEVYEPPFDGIKEASYKVVVSSASGVRRGKDDASPLDLFKMLGRLSPDWEPTKQQ